MGNRIEQTKPPPQRRLAAKLAACAVALCAGAVLGARRRSVVRGASRSTSSTRRSPARGQQAQALGAQIDATSAELASAQQQAIVAAQREAQLSAVLAAGEERERRLEGEVTVAKRPAARPRAPNCGAPSTRSPAASSTSTAAGCPTPTTLLLRGGRHGRPPDPRRVPDAGSRRPTRRWSPACARCATRSPDRLAAVEDAAAAARRSSTSRSPRRATRSPPSAPRPRPAPQQLQALRAQRQAAIDSLQSQVSGWTDRRSSTCSGSPPSRPRARSTSGSATGRSPSRSSSASRAATSAPSTRRPGAGGAYQILPSTWDLYGGQGDPQDASPPAADATSPRRSGRTRAPPPGSALSSAVRAQPSGGVRRAITKPAERGQRPRTRRRRS